MNLGSKKSMSDVCVLDPLPNAPLDPFANDEIYCWNYTANASYWVQAEQFSCAVFDRGECPCPELKADADIAGIGVIIAFMISALLTVLSTILCLLLIRTDGLLSPSTGTWPDPSTRPATLNRIDNFSRHKICRPFVLFLRNSLGWNTAVLASCASDLVQALSDTQLVTGLAVLVGAMVGLYRSDGAEPISVYHFTIAMDLAWFAATTHMASLLVLKYRRRESAKQKSQRGFALKLPISLRLVLMVIFLGMFLRGSLVEGYACWFKTMRCPAKCTLPYERGGEPMQWMIVNIVLIVSGYGFHLLELSHTIRRWWLEHLRKYIVSGKPVTKFERQKTVIGNIKSVLRVMGGVVRITYFWIWNILASEICEVLEMLTWFSLGVYGVFQDRRYGHEDMSDLQEHIEDRLGFGQLIPLVLLLLPVLALVESYAHHTEAHKRRSRSVEGCEGCEWEDSWRLGGALH
ncbi:hypothetical protein QBC35DRAFT_525041 [Podospora australis]|uniref:Uncharacterized protein n=1 Tax=Podospora australis TaxID=1536484 RepID=A0AAN6WPT5_9PEZI|nr:hypothetical protein QBC35DRAFT_525041 [Podospora australis]